MAEKLLQIRKQVKKKKPTYKRVQSNQYPRFKNDSKWRRPKGKGNKDRRNRKGHVGRLKVGYGSPVEIRGTNREGFFEVQIYNIGDLEKVGKQEIAVIASSVGNRKKIEILKTAESKKIKISNVKDITSTIKSLQKVKKEVVKKEEKIVEEKTKEEKKEWTLVNKRN